jgi:hypothetical protein
MDKWLKIGLPIMVAVLLVVAAVGITLATVSANGQVASAYRTGYTVGAQYAYGPGYGGCPAWNSNYNSAGPGGCWNYNG